MHGKERRQAKAVAPSWGKGRVRRLLVPDQALEEERLGPRRQPYSDERQKRLAVQEAATALVCTLMPAIEPVTMARTSMPFGFPCLFHDFTIC
jgi:hypothetical protein